MEKIKFLRVGPIALYPKATSLKVGDKVTMEKNKYAQDPTALFLTVDGQAIGFCANKATTCGGYAMASEIIDKIEDLAEAVIVEIKDGQIICEVTIDAEEEANANNVKSIYIVCGGNSAIYKNRYEPKKDFVEGKELPIELLIDEAKPVLKYKEGLCCEPISEADRSYKGLSTECKKMGYDVKPLEELVKFVGDDASSAKAAIVGKTTTMSWIVKVSMATIAQEVKEAVTVDFNKLLEDVDEMKKERIMSRVNWVTSNTENINEALIAQFINRLAQHETISEFCPKFVNSDRIIEKSFIAMLQGTALRAVGPAGCGKNVFITTLANLFDLKLVDLSFSADTDRDMLLGAPTMVAKNSEVDEDKVNACFKNLLVALGSEGAGLCNMSKDEQISKIEALDGADYMPLIEALKADVAEIKFEPSELVKALEEPCLINFDEANTARGEITALLHPLLDTRGYIVVPGYRKVDKIPETNFTLTMNEDYEGTRPLNRAFRDRFKAIRFKPAKSIKEVIKASVPGIGKNDLKVLDALYKKIQGKVGSEFDEDSFSVRAFIRCASEIVAGMDTKSSIIDNIVDDIDNEDDRASVKAILDLMVK